MKVELSNTKEILKIENDNMEEACFRIHFIVHWLHPFVSSYLQI